MINIIKDIMKIYTKVGDKGKTNLYGNMVSKSDIRIDAYGTIDELNSFIGLADSFNKNHFIHDILIKVQNELFIIGSDLSHSYKNEINSNMKIVKENIVTLEKFIDDTDKKILKLTNFILPSGSNVAAFLHVCRSLCRKAERKIVLLSEKYSVNSLSLIYLNRLSDLLFVLARYSNNLEDCEELIWNSKS